MQAYQRKIYDKTYKEEIDRPLDKIELLRFQKVLNQVKKYVRLDEKFRVLDIGCGTGKFLKFLPIKHKYGVDISPIAVEKAVKNGIDAKTVNVESEKLPYESNFFDLITCMEMLEHLFNASLLLSEVRRVLKPGGYVYVTVPNDVYRLKKRLGVLVGKYFLDLGHNNLYTVAHIRFFRKSLLKNLFLNEGFKIVYVGGLPLSYKGYLLPLGGFLATHLTDLLVFHYSLLARKP